MDIYARFLLLGWDYHPSTYFILFPSRIKLYLSSVITYITIIVLFPFPNSLLYSLVIDCDCFPITLIQILISGSASGETQNETRATLESMLVKVAEPIRLGSWVAGWSRPLSHQRHIVPVPPDDSTFHKEKLNLHCVKPLVFQDVSYRASAHILCMPHFPFGRSPNIKQIQKGKSFQLDESLKFSYYSGWIFFLLCWKWNLRFIIQEWPRFHSGMGKNKLRE